jgi:hypothetical protein
MALVKLFDRLDLGMRKMNISLGEKHGALQDTNGPNAEETESASESTPEECEEKL